MVRNALSNKRMRKLQEERSTSTEQQHVLSAYPPRGRFRPADPLNHRHCI
jgi:hypothetical protein